MSVGLGIVTVVGVTVAVWAIATALLWAMDAVRGFPDDRFVNAAWITSGCIVLAYLIVVTRL